MAASARPWPFLDFLDHPGGDRIVLDIADCGEQVAIVHRVTCEAALEQIAAPALTEIDPSRVEAVRLAESRAQAVGALRDEDQMNVVVHQAPGDAARAVGRAGIRHEREIGATVFIGEEDRQSAIAALRDMVRDMRDDDASEPGHVQVRNRRAAVSLFSIVSPEFTVAELSEVNELAMAVAGVPTSLEPFMDSTLESAESKVGLETGNSVCR